MRKVKNIITWMLIASMLCSSLAPIQKVEADTITEASTEDNTEASTENNTSTDENTETSTEASTQDDTSTEEKTEVSTEDNTSTEEKTEVSTEDNTSTEEKIETSTEEKTETEQEAVNSNYIVSKLSPITAKVIVLDPGHCKVHPGASGNGLREEVVVLDITKACLNSLKTYGDVTVYMTRDTGSCCTDLDLGDCLISRNNYAKILDADFLISMHINAGYTNGANVLAAYKSGYNDNIRVETQKFGKIALKKLKALGIANRGLLLRKSEAGNRYSNGKLTDYYSIVRNGVKQNIPSVIIEHGYISSSSDCSKFFKTAAKRKKVGQADAKAIISYYSLKQKVTDGEFVEEDGATYYVTSKGKKVTGWIKEDEKWYYFDPGTAKRKAGFMTYGGEKVYLSPSTGEMLVGWFVVNGSKYLAKGNGAIVRNQTYSDGQYTYLFNSNGKLLKKGFHTVQGATYYVDSKRHVVSGVQKIKGKYYGFDPETKQRLYGYQKISGKYYYFNPETGVASTKKIVKVKGKRYYFGANGARQTGWVNYNGSKYYFNKKNGVISKGWKKINKKYYYFNKSTGKMQKSKWIGKYYVNSKGIRTKKK